MDNFINSFKKGIQAKIKGAEKRYEVKDIFIKEDNNTGICGAYIRGETEKISIAEYRRILVNIEDEKDIITYKVIALPGGRCRTINEQANKFSLYSFGSMFQVLYGEEKTPYMMTTKQEIDELISLYEAQKQSMKYYRLEEVNCKGKVIYIGTYSEEGKIVEEELFGNALSEITWEQLDKQRRKVIVDSSCLQDFIRQRYNLNFTKDALQNIVERNRDIEKQCE